MNNALQHYGIPQRSGRYPWGSGENPYHHTGKKAVDKIASAGSKIGKTSSNAIKNLAAKSKERKEAKKESEEKKVPKTIKDLTNDELREKINRLELEKEFSRLYKEVYSTTKSAKGKQFVTKVLEKSGENIATQFVTYEMGSLVNKIAQTMSGDPNKTIVNPKKGQKEK